MMRWLHFSEGADLIPAALKFVYVLRPAATQVLGGPGAI
jgi:hypothetical protein